MWKEINKNYRKAVGLYNQSGIHAPNFLDIDNRKGDKEGDDDFYKFSDLNSVYYLRKHLQLHPNGNDLVRCTIQENMWVDTSMELNYPTP